MQQGSLYQFQISDSFRHVCDWNQGPRCFRCRRCVCSSLRHGSLCSQVTENMHLLGRQERKCWKYTKSWEHATGLTHMVLGTQDWSPKSARHLLTKVDIKQQNTPNNETQSKSIGLPQSNCRRFHTFFVWLYVCRCEQARRTTHLQEYNNIVDTEYVGRVHSMSSASSRSNSSNHRRCRETQSNPSQS